MPIWEDLVKTTAQLLWLPSVPNGQEMSARSCPLFDRCAGPGLTAVGPGLTAKHRRPVAGQAVPNASKLALANPKPIWTSLREPLKPKVTQEIATSLA